VIELVFHVGQRKLGLGAFAERTLGLAKPSSFAESAGGGVRRGASRNLHHVQNDSARRRELYRWRRC
jgi:hypothetical protein